MARIRTIKPEFFRDERICALSHAARLLFIGLWTLADREGRLVAQPGQLRIDLFPTEPRVDVARLLDDLEREGLIARWEQQGIRYLVIPHFGRHQRPNVREPQSELPAPPESLDKSTTHVHARADTCAHVQEHSGTLGREGKGREDPPSSPPTPIHRPRAARARLPADFTLTEVRQAFATKGGYSADEIHVMFRHFQAHHRSRGNVMADWDAAWEQWVLKEYKLDAQRQPVLRGMRGSAPRASPNPSPPVAAREPRATDPAAAEPLRQFLERAKGTR